MVECLPTMHEALGSIYSTSEESQHLGWLRSTWLSLVSKYMRPNIKNNKNISKRPRLINSELAWGRESGGRGTLGMTQSVPAGLAGQMVAVCVDLANRTSWFWGAERLVLQFFASS